MEKKYNSKATIETILSVSAQLFLEKGFDKTGMQDIAKTAGLSKGAIYHHFRSKEEILLAVNETQEKAAKAMLDTLLEQSDSLNGKEQLLYIFEKTLESPEIHHLDSVINTRMKSAEFIVSYMRHCVRTNAPIVSAIIKKGIKDGSISSAFPDECAEAVLLLVNVWCDPAIFNWNKKELHLRLTFIQHMMSALNLDILTDSLVTKIVQVLSALYFDGEDLNE